MCTHTFNIKRYVYKKTYCWTFEDLWWRMWNVYTFIYSTLSSTQRRVFGLSVSSNCSWINWAFWMWSEDMFLRVENELRIAYCCGGAECLAFNTWNGIGDKHLQMTKTVFDFDFFCLYLFPYYFWLKRGNCQIWHKLVMLAEGGGSRNSLISAGQETGCQVYYDSLQTCY